MQPPPLLPQLQTRSRRNRQVLPLLRLRAGDAGAKQRGALLGPEFQPVTQGVLPCGYLTTGSEGPCALKRLRFADARRVGRSERMVFLSAAPALHDSQANSE
jgi:hypothetical protein